MKPSITHEANSKQTFTRARLAGVLIPDVLKLFANCVRVHREAGPMPALSMQVGETKIMLSLCPSYTDSPPRPRIDIWRGSKVASFEIDPNGKYPTMTGDRFNLISFKHGDWVSELEAAADVLPTHTASLVFDDMIPTNATVH